ncbi:Membrane-associated guanylate kinase, WW and PDZ domain-containing protein 1 [Echinococcus granulosus]|nr:Membrane-associated guanylate kinase, WW and PDZ domain-containing protein 1 [Echinococcus granulosus]
MCCCCWLRRRFAGSADHPTETYLTPYHGVSAAAWTAELKRYSHETDFDACCSQHGLSRAMTPPPEEMQFYNNQFCHHQQQQPHQQQKERAVFFPVTLFRSSRGLGFAIRRGRGCNQMPFTVSRVIEGGPAHLDGRLKVGDELLQINGFKTAGMSYHRVVEIIRAGGKFVRLGVRRSLLPTGEMRNFAALSSSSPLPPPLPPPLPALSSARYSPLPPIPSSAPVVEPQPPPATPPPLPYLRSLELLTPSSMHNSSIGSPPLLSSGKCRLSLYRFCNAILWIFLMVNSVFCTASTVSA